jgi:hypothetical protein
MSRLRIGGVPLRRGNQIVGYDEFRSRHRIERQFCLAPVGSEANITAGSSEQAATETLAAIDRPRQLDLGLETAETVVILAANQRSIDPWGADLEHISAGYRVGDIEKSRHVMADLRTIIERHWSIVEPLGHYLESWPPTARDDHPDKTIAHCFERRLNRLRDAMGVNQLPGTSPNFPMVWVCSADRAVCAKTCLSQIGWRKQKVGRRPTRPSVPDDGPQNVY